MKVDIQLAIAQHHEKICRKHIALCELAILKLDRELALQNLSLFNGKAIVRC